MSVSRDSSGKECLNDYCEFIERFLLSFKALGATSDGFIDYKLFQKYLKQAGENGTEILNLIKEEGCVLDDRINIFHLCSSLLETKVAFNNLSLENGLINDNINSRTYTRKKSSFQAAARTSTSAEKFDYKACQQQITGALFNVGGDLFCNRYLIDIFEDTYIEMFIKPMKDDDLNRNEPMELLILQDKDKVLTSSLFNHSEKYSTVKHHFKKGKYVLLPIGLMWPGKECESVNLASLIDLNEDGQIVLTEACDKVLRTVFNTIDLDQNGLLSQLEFDLFIQYTSGETAANEWSTIEDNFHTEDHQLTFEGFTELYKLVLQTDPSDVIHMLQLMGVNDELQQEYAQPFTLFIKSERSQFSLSFFPVASYRSFAEKTLCRMAIEQGFSKKVKNMNDLLVYTFKLPHLVVVVVQNQSHCKVKVRLDCNKSINYQSHRNVLDYTVEVMPKTSILGHYLVPVDPQKPCSFECTDELK